MVRIRYRTVKREKEREGPKSEGRLGEKKTEGKGRREGNFKSEKRSD